MHQNNRRKRYAHLAGSFPYEDEATAMRKSMDFLGHSLRSLPNGEIGMVSERPKHGNRFEWAEWVVTKLKESGALEIAKHAGVRGKQGLWPDLRRASSHKLLVKPEDLHRYLDFGLSESFAASYQVFRRLRTQHKWNVKFQVGIPGPLAIATFSLGIMEGIRYRRIFEDRLVYECNEIFKIARDDVVFQLEIPLELGFLLKAPMIFRPAVREWAVNNIVSLVRRLDERAIIGIHLCLRYVTNAVIRNVKPLVKFTNEIVRQWPKSRTLHYVHMPLAMAGTRPATGRGFYEGLRKLRLPHESRFIAGFVDEGLTENEHTRILAIIEGSLKRSVDVSSSCGLGRGSREAADDLLVTIANLVR